MKTLLQTSSNGTDLPPAPGTSHHVASKRRFCFYLGLVIMLRCILHSKCYYALYVFCCYLCDAIMFCLLVIIFKTILLKSGAACHAFQLFTKVSKLVINYTHGGLHLVNRGLNTFQIISGFLYNIALVIVVLFSGCKKFSLWDGTES